MSGGKLLISWDLMRISWWFCDFYVNFMGFSGILLGYNGK
jgi:hypothetical protein